MKNMIISVPVPTEKAGYTLSADRQGEKKAAAEIKAKQTFGAQNFDEIAPALQRALRENGETLQTLSSQTALWMAGGISADNIQEIVKSFHPELVDLSSALESFPGKKSAEKMRAFFRAVR